MDSKYRFNILKLPIFIQRKISMQTSVFYMWSKTF